MSNVCIQTSFQIVTPILQLKFNNVVVQQFRFCSKFFSFHLCNFKVQYIIIQAILSRKSMKNFAVTDEKYSMSV